MGLARNRHTRRKDKTAMPILSNSPKNTGANATVRASRRWGQGLSLTLALCVAPVMATVIGCSGTVDPGESVTGSGGAAAGPGGKPGGSTGGGGAGAGTSPGTGSGGTTSTGSGGGNPATGTGGTGSTADPNAAGLLSLRRLTSREYLNTV